MNKLLLVVFSLFSFIAGAQTDTTKWVRGFPITDYMVDLNDSMKVVQIVLPGEVTIKDKQVGLLRGIYRDKPSDTMLVGAGRCNLIKGEYYYFSINYKKSGKSPKQGDLLFAFVDKSPVYRGNIVKLTAFYIGLKNVYEMPLYDRAGIFKQWKKSDEDILMDSMVADIRFTGNYFLANNPTMNVAIKSGKHTGKMVLNTMQICDKKDVIDFLEYMIARPNFYAGNNWKIAEIFATWLSLGGPTVIK